MAKSYASHMGRGIDLKKFHQVWRFIVEEGPVSAIEIAKHNCISQPYVMRILNSLSAHDIPVYEDDDHRKLLYGALIDYPDNKFYENMDSQPSRSMKYTSGEYRRKKNENQFVFND